MRQKRQIQLTLYDEFEGWFPARHFTSDKHLAKIGRPGITTDITHCRHQDAEKKR